MTINLLTTTLDKNANSPLLIVGICIILGCSSDVTAETLKSSILYLYSNNPVILSSEQEINAQNEIYVQAREGFGPQVSVRFEGDYQQATIEQIDTAGRKYASNLIGRTSTTALEVTQPVYSGGRLTALVTSAQADILAQREALRITVSQTFRDAIRAYGDVVRDEQVTTAARSAQNLLEQDLSDMQQKFLAGAATLTDRAEVLARLAAARVQVANTEGQLLESRSDFLSVIGREPSNLEPLPALPALPTTRTEAIAVALRENPAMKQAIFEEASARAKIALAQSAFSPNVSLELSANSEPLAQYANLNDNNVNFGIVVSVPLFASGITLSKLRQAEALDRSASIKIEAARRSVVQQCDQALFATDTAKRSVFLLKEEVRADQVAYESLNEQFKSGLISTIDLLNAEQELTNAKISLAGAEHDLPLAQADLLAATGRLEPDVLIPEADPRNPEVAFNRLHILGAEFPSTLFVREIDRMMSPRLIAERHVEQEPQGSVQTSVSERNSLGDMNPAQMTLLVPHPEIPQ